MIGPRHSGTPDSALCVILRGTLAGAWKRTNRAINQAMNEPSEIEALAKLADGIGRRDEFESTLRSLGRTAVPAEVLAQLLEKGPVDARPHSPSLIVKHWRGGYGLGVSYWLIGICVGLLSSLFAWFITELYWMEPWSVTIQLLMLLAPVISLCGLTVWQAVGVWRSAGWSIAINRRTRRTNFWAYAARVMTLLGLISQTPALIESASELEEMLRDGFLEMAQRPSIFPDPDDPTTLIFEGDITVGTGYTFRQQVERYPGLKRLVLRSDGGRIVEAEHMAKVVARRGLDTHVIEECSSACTLVFLDGQARTIRPYARLGFHRVSNNTDTVDEQVAATRAVYPRLSDDFVASIVATSPAEMLYPSNDWLLREQLITEWPIPTADDFTFIDADLAPLAPAVFDALQTQARNGDSDSAYQVAYAYALGQPVARDLAMSRALFEVLAGDGVGAAQSALAEFYEFGVGGVSADAQWALFWAIRSLQNGVTSAQMLTDYYQGRVPALQVAVPDLSLEVVPEFGARWDEPLALGTDVYLLEAGDRNLVWVPSAGQLGLVDPGHLAPNTP